jgi:hypothetical protein
VRDQYQRNFLVPTHVFLSQSPYWYLCFETQAMLACSYWSWTIFAQVVRAVSDGYFEIFRGIAAPIVIARPLDIRKYLYNSAKKGTFSGWKLLICHWLWYTHHVCANTDIVNLAIIDGLTKNLLQEKIAVLFVYDVYQCIVAGVEYFIVHLLCVGDQESYS